jgi:hypothetical protein
MKHLHCSAAAALILCATAILPSAASAQPAAPAAPDTFVTWIEARVLAAIAAKKAAAQAAAEEKKVGDNGNGTANQKEAPSADSASTSLVDSSAASDFVSLALSLSGLTPTEDDESKPKSGSITVTAYSLAAGIKGVALTDPQFYKNATKWRRLALTIGSEDSKPEEVFTDKASTNIGVKFLIINSRDVYSNHAQNEFNRMDAAVGVFQRLELDDRNRLECVIFRAVTGRAASTADCRTADPTAFAAFLATNPFDTAQWPSNHAELEKHVDAMAAVNGIVESIAAAKVTALDQVAAAVERIQKARQLSIAYFTKRRQDEGTDEHRIELIFDYGLSDRLNWTVNGSYDRKDRKKAETKDSDSGRLATEFQAKLTSPGSQVWSAAPVLIAGSAEASKESAADWLIRTQVKVTIPVATGITIPIAYTYASRASEGIEAGPAFKFSLSIDPVRLRERFR